MIDDLEVTLSITDLKPEQFNLAETGGGIPVITADLSYSEFFESFLLKNCPVLIKGHFTNDWESKLTWVQDEKPSFLYLKKKFGHSEVPVADCNRRLYNVQEKNTLQLCDYLEYWLEYVNKNYPHAMPCLYLKDWHFVKEFPQHSVYRVPPYFASDWLNEYYCDNTEKNDDYRFVYMGPKGSWTPFHADVFTSFSWSVNICGQKKWLLFPPGQENYLRNKYGHLPYDCRSDEIKDEKMYPYYKDLKVCFEVIQEAGEAIFVPSGWHHQVWNMKDTISINHNWINGCNIKSMWLSLKNHLADVKKEIEDCKEMEDWSNHCQIMLRASFGLDYTEFYKFLLHVSKKRIAAITEDHSLIVYGNWKIGKKHAIFDLQQIKEILNILLSDCDMHASLKDVVFQKPDDLLSEINAILSVHS